jgi:hypothetical protein
MAASTWIYSRLAVWICFSFVFVSFTATKSVLAQTPTQIRAASLLSEPDQQASPETLPPTAAERGLALSDLEAMAVQNNPLSRCWPHALEPHAASGCRLACGLIRVLATKANN